MRFLLAVMALSVTLSVSGAAQKTRPYNPKSSGADAKAPKSTAPPPKAAGTASSGKDLQKVENSSGKGGHSGQAKKTNVGIVKSDRSSGNPPINFNGKGGGGNTGTRNPGSLKGRLKQKGQGKQH